MGFKKKKKRQQSFKNTHCDKHRTGDTSSRQEAMHCTHGTCTSPLLTQPLTCAGGALGETSGCGDPTMRLCDPPIIPLPLGWPLVGPLEQRLAPHRCLLQRCWERVMGGKKTRYVLEDSFILVYFISFFLYFIGAA